MVYKGEHGMRAKEAIYILDHLRPADTKDSFDAYIVGEALAMAINALEQEPTKEEKALLQKWRDNRGISIEDFEDAMNTLKEPSGELISRQAVIDIIHLFFTEEIDKIPTKKTEDGEVLVIRKCQPLFEMNKAICKRIKALPSVSPTQNCVGNTLEMR